MQNKMYLLHNKLGVSKVSLEHQPKHMHKLPKEKKHKTSNNQTCMFMYIPLKGAEVTCVNRVLILLQSYLCTTATFGKWQGDTCIQGGSYIQVNFAENIKHLKILGSFLVTVRYRVTAIYRAVIYRFECSVINFVRNSVRQHPMKRD